MKAKEFYDQQKVITLPINSIDIDKDYIRQTKTDITGLKQTISDVGLLQPIIVQQLGDRYILIDGERRLNAMRDLAITDLIVGRDVVVDMEETVADVKFKQIISNIQREDINDVELGHAFVLLKEQFGYEYREIAEIIGKTPHYVSAKVGLAIRLVQDVQTAYVKDIEAEKCNRVTSEFDSGEIPDSYLMSVKVVEAIARLPTELQMPSYAEIKKNCMDKKEAMGYISSIQKDTVLLSIANNIKEIVEPYVPKKIKDDRVNILDNNLYRINRDIEKFAINVKSSDYVNYEEVIPVLESLITKLNSLYDELKSDYKVNDYITITG